MLRYAGGGFLPGVPARDLTDEEVRAHGESFLIASGFYLRVEHKAAHGGRSNKAVTPAAPAAGEKAEEEGEA